MENKPRGLPVAMFRPDLKGIPQYDLPAGYSLRLYESGDRANWVAIHELADDLQIVTPEKFDESFQGDETQLKQRQYYLCGADGAAIGTATAWYDSPACGRVHWVAIVPQFQHRGLAKPLLAAVMNPLAGLGHTHAVLGTNTARIAAIGLYLKFGFRPRIRHRQDATSWQRAREGLPDSPLARMQLDGA